MKKVLLILSAALLILGTASCKNCCQKKAKTNEEKVECCKEQAACDKADCCKDEPACDKAECCKDKASCDKKECSDKKDCCK